MTKVEVFKKIEKDLCTREYIFSKVSNDLEVVDVEITKNFSIKMNNIYKDEELNYTNSRSSSPDTYSVSFKKGEKYTAIVRKEAKVLVAVINDKFCLCPKSRKQEILVNAFETWTANTNEISKNDLQDKLDTIINAIKNGGNPFLENKESKKLEALDKLVEFLETSDIVESVTESERYDFDKSAKMPTKKFIIKCPDGVSTYSKEIEIFYENGKQYRMDNNVLFEYVITESLLEYLKEYGEQLAELRKLVVRVKEAERL